MPFYSTSREGIGGRPQTTRFVRTCEVCGNAFATVPSKHQRFCSYPCGTIGRQRTLEERFWKHVQKTDSCWLWTGATDEARYGKIRSASSTHELVGAHRVSWELAYGPIPDDLWVLHNCPGGDNPSCVNPDHLFLGTNSDNMLDAAKKGRMSHSRLKKN